MYNTRNTVAFRIPDLSFQDFTLSLEYEWAAGNSVAEYAYSDVDESLMIRGVLVDVIKHVSSPASHTASTKELVALCHSWEPLDVLNASYIGGGSMFDAFTCTLIYSQTQEKTSLFTSLTYPTIEECRSSLLSCVQKNRVDSTSGAYITQLQEMLPGRAFFTTLDGRIGLCPAAAKSGDWVSVILGCSSPLLLRPVQGSSEQYQLVGECYLPGLTLSEALLGPLPSHCQAHVESIGLQVYSLNGMKSQEDPRMGLLPSGWRSRYGQGKAHEFDRHVNIRGRWFENIETRECSWTDPRLRSVALKARGVDIKDFCIIWSYDIIIQRSADLRLLSSGTKEKRRHFSKSLN
jgi:hypothetical protein